MVFNLDGNRVLNAADSHVGVSVTLSQSSGLSLNVSSWTQDVLHVTAQTMAAAGDRGIPVTVPLSDLSAALAWALLFYGYSTGESYEKSLAWVSEKSGSVLVNEDDDKWKTVKEFLWP